MFHANYDIIVVGAGISGLYTAREILKRNPKYTVAIAERYKGLGGRTYSYWPPDFPGVHWEMGAGRIRSDHKILMNLIKEYGLTWIPIGEDISYLGGPEHSNTHLVPNTFESMMIPVYLEPLLSLEPDVLANSTIEKLMKQIYGEKKTAEILAHFPYRGEVDTMRADVALESFIGKGEMSSHKGYGVLKEGFSELIARLQDDCMGRGAVVLNRHRLVDVESGPGQATDLTFDFGLHKPGEVSGQITLRAMKACVLALHRDALAELDTFKGWSTLAHLKTQPLLRCYAIFDTKKGPVWFKDLVRVVTPARPRYILPMDAGSGTIMISYTDGSDAKPYMARQKEDGDKGLEKMVMTDIRKLFPDRDIPKPLFFRSHPWETGCTYWLPGNYDPITESLESVHPMPSELPGVWLCGESWSMRQAWVEGALEQAEVMLKSADL